MKDSGSRKCNRGRRRAVGVSPIPATRTATRFHRRVDRHHPAAAVRHHHAGAGVRHSHRLHGRHAARSAIICWWTSWPTRPRGRSSKHILPYTEPKRGDIIVFRYPVDIRQTFVKRVIGVPGDHIQLVNKQVYLNGHAAQRAVRLSQDRLHRFLPRQFPRRAQRVTWPTAPARCSPITCQNGEVVVPPGYYFAMGDNRDNSLDSRYWGFVPRENIIGKPLIIFWSYDAPTEELVRAHDVGRPPARSGAALFRPRRAGAARCSLIRGYPFNS